LDVLSLLQLALRLGATKYCVAGFRARRLAMRIPREWSLLGALLGIVIGITANIAMVAPVSSQNSSATVSLAQAEYLTLNTRNPGGLAGPKCCLGDSGAAEIISKQHENTTPGSSRH
jgi:hypothetical protein